MDPSWELNTNGREKGEVDQLELSSPVSGLYNGITMRTFLYKISARSSSELIS